MNFLKKLFGRSEPQHQPQTPQPQAPQPSAAPASKNPDNTRFHYLLGIYVENPSNENYAAVVKELMEGDGFLLLPSQNDGRILDGWQDASGDETLKLTSVFNMDGLKVLGAFGSEEALLEWSGTKTEYTAMRSPDVLEMCRTQGIDRIVINSGRDDMFVLERRREGLTETPIEEDTQVLMFTPASPLPRPLLDKLAHHFEKVDSIEEAYQYGQTMKGETGIVLGIRFSVRSDDATAALNHALGNALAGEDIGQPLFVLILDDRLLEAVRGIQDSLFYRRR